MFCFIFSDFVGLLPIPSFIFWLIMLLHFARWPIEFIMLWQVLTQHKGDQGFGQEEGKEGQALLSQGQNECT